MNGPKIHVLLVEDNPADARLIQETLAGFPGAPFRVECVDRLSTCVNRLAKGSIDVVLLDLGLPDSYGLETFTRVHAGLPTRPVVILSGAADEQLAAAAVAVGASDYLVKNDAGYRAVAHSLLQVIERHQEEQVRRLSAELEQLEEEEAAGPEAALPPAGTGRKPA